VGSKNRQAPSARPRSWDVPGSWWPVSASPNAPVTDLRVPAKIRKQRALQQRHSAHKSFDGARPHTLRTLISLCRRLDPTPLDLLHRMPRPLPLLAGSPVGFPTSLAMSTTLSGNGDLPRPHMATTRGKSCGHWRRESGWQQATSDLAALDLKTKGLGQNLVDKYCTEYQPSSGFLPTSLSCSCRSAAFRSPPDAARPTNSESSPGLDVLPRRGLSPTGGVLWLQGCGVARLLPRLIRAAKQHSTAEQSTRQLDNKAGQVDSFKVCPYQMPRPIRRCLSPERWDDRTCLLLGEVDTRKKRFLFNYQLTRN
jgi:hypothetical protein